MSGRSTRRQRGTLYWECLCWWDQRIHGTSPGFRKWARRLFKRKAKPQVQREIAEQQESR